MFNTALLKSLKNYLVLALVLALISWFALPQDNIQYKIINAFFCGGAGVLCAGGFGLAAYLGGFDLFYYTKSFPSIPKRIWITPILRT